MNRVVGISEMLVSTDPRDVLVTYSLGSCVGVTIYDPWLQVGGMAHCMLPLSEIDPAKAERKPCMFVDRAVPMLLEKLLRLGAEKKRLVVKVAGASELMGEMRAFKIGERNYAILRKLLWKNDILIDAEDVGGQMSRTVIFNLGTGRVTIKARGKEWEL